MSQHVLFDAPYNRDLPSPGPPRLRDWASWRTVLWPLLGRNGTSLSAPSSPYIPLGQAPPASPSVATYLYPQMNLPRLPLPPVPLPLPSQPALPSCSLAQQKQDMLLLLREPLSPESICSIVSGSACQLGTATLPYPALPPYHATLTFPCHCITRRRHGGPQRASGAARGNAMRNGICFWIWTSND